MGRRADYLFSPLVYMVSFIERLLPECKLAIVYAARIGDRTDRVTLFALVTLSKSFNEFICANLHHIISHYTVKELYPDRTQYTFCGQLHRDGDQPAIIYITGLMRWYQFGQCHRGAVYDTSGAMIRDLPAVIYPNGMQAWYHRGLLHRDIETGEPALICSDGARFWYWNNKHHRGNDQPAIIEADGSRYWYKNGKLHRDIDNGPAIIRADGTQEWWLHGQRQPDSL